MKVTATEFDRFILMIPRLNLKQLDRLDTHSREERLRKTSRNLAPVQPDAKEVTP